MSRVWPSSSQSIASLLGCGLGSDLATPKGRFCFSEAILLWSCSGVLGCCPVAPPTFYIVSADVQRFSYYPGELSDMLGNSSFPQWFQAGQALMQQSRPKSWCLLHHTLRLGWWFHDDMPCPFYARCSAVCFFQNSSILVSSVHKTFCQSRCGVSMCSFANFRHAAMFFFSKQWLPSWCPAVDTLL